MGFSGFPVGVKYTPVPNPLFGALLEEIDDPEELKTTLRVLWLAYQKKGYPRYVTLRELLGDATLARSLKAQGAELDGVLKRVLAQARARGTLLHTALDRHEKSEELYMLNTEENRRALASMAEEGFVSVAESAVEPWQGPMTRPNIFALYEENIGMLTPLIAEDLKEAEQVYPQVWLEEAFRQAVTYNKRNWRYVARILERWATEGRDDGESGRYSKTIDAKEYLRKYTP